VPANLAQPHNADSDFLGRHHRNSVSIED